MLVTFFYFLAIPDTRSAVNQLSAPTKLLQDIGCGEGIICQRQAHPCAVLNKNMQACLDHCLPQTADCANTPSACMSTGIPTSDHNLMPVNSTHLGTIETLHCISDCR